MDAHFEVTTQRVFSIAGPAMLANVTTPLLGIVATAAIGRLGDAAVLGGVGMASVVFDCMFWLFGFLRMSTIALTAQALSAGDSLEQHAVLARALTIAAAVGLALIALQVPLAASILGAMGGSDAVNEAARQYFLIRLWSAPFALANYAMLGWLVGLGRAGRALSVQIVINVINMTLTATLVLHFDYGVAGAALAAILAEACGLALGLGFAWTLLGGGIAVTRAAMFERTQLVRMLAINRDIMIRTAALIAAFLFFAARGARSGDVTLAANSVLHNLVLIGAFFLDGIANAAEQLCGRAFGARDRKAFSRAVQLVVAWGFAFGLAATLLFFSFGAALVDLMTASPQVRHLAYDFLFFAALAPVCGVLAFCYDGIYVGATWARDMRNLMIASFLIYLAVWGVTQPLGNAGLWIAILSFFVARGLLQMARYPALVRKSFA